MFSVGAPASGHIHIAVVDTGGAFASTSLSNVLETYYNIEITDALTYSFDPKRINEHSKYIFSNGDYADFIVTSNLVPTKQLIEGVDGDAITNTEIIDGYNKYKSVEDIAVNILISGAHDSDVSVHIINNICEVRKDCVVVLSVPKDAVVNNPGSEETAIANFAATLPVSSYAFVDGNWKYRIDGYNGVSRWVPCNPDTAGLMAASKYSWDSPAKDGNIKNVIKLAWNPNRDERDTLYANKINPIVNFKSRGTLLYGDKTLYIDNSAFSRINVRRLFIELRVTFDDIARNYLFRNNTETTRTQFSNDSNQYMRSVKASDGVYDYKFVCDSSNNTAEIIDQQILVAELYVRPVRSINWILIALTGTTTGANFSEIESAFKV